MPKRGPVTNFAASHMIYIYHIPTCRVRNSPQQKPYLSQNLASEMFNLDWNISIWDWSLEKFQKVPEIRSKMAIFWVKSWPNYVAQHAWTSFWLRQGPIFDSGNFTFFGHFWDCQNILNWFESVFSKKLQLLSSPKQLGTLYPPLQKYYRQLFCVCGINFVGLTGKSVTCLPETISGELISMGLPESLAGSQHSVRRCELVTNKDYRKYW